VKVAARIHRETDRVPGVFRYGSDDDRCVVLRPFASNPSAWYVDGIDGGVSNASRAAALVSGAVQMVRSGQPYATPYASSREEAIALLREALDLAEREQERMTGRVAQETSARG
jgi:hypothetical protein